MRRSTLLVAALALGLLQQAGAETLTMWVANS
jgi:hypothetical protein